jgi:hypothetical protein
MFAHEVVVVDELVAVAISRSEVEFFTPTPITVLLFSRSLLTSGEKSESPLMITNRSTCDLV